MREFKPQGTVNQSAKKREKRKAKKQEQMRLEAEKQAELLAKEVSRQKELYFQ